MAPFYFLFVLVVAIIVVVLPLAASSFVVVVSSTTTSSSNRQNSRNSAAAPTHSTPALSMTWKDGINEWLSAVDDAVDDFMSKRMGNGEVFYGQRRYKPSGRPNTSGKYNGMDVMVKDNRRYKDTSGWGFFNFGHHAPPYADTGKAAPAESCAACHQANAEKDMVFTQFYPILHE